MEAGSAARTLLAGLAGALVEAALGLPLSPVFASPFAGAVAGFLAGPPPHRGLVAGFLAALLGVSALASGIIYLGGHLAGLPGALLAAAPASALLLIGAFSSIFAALAGAAAAGIRAARSR
jgi:hypothetical protein